MEPRPNTPNKVHVAATELPHSVVVWGGNRTHTQSQSQTLCNSKVNWKK